NSRARYTRAMEKMAPSLEFLPDQMVIEAEWRAKHALGQKLEEDRAAQGAKRHLFAAGAFCSRVGQAAEKRVACPRNEFRCPRLRAHLKETSQCYRERYD